MSYFENKYRQDFFTGTVILDLDEDDLHGIATRVVENLVLSDQVEPEHQNAILHALLGPHRYTIAYTCIFSRSMQ